jgi:hypothetical protein
LNLFPLPDLIQKAPGFAPTHDTQLTGVYFDDCILTVDDPSNVVKITSGLWLL